MIGSIFRAADTRYISCIHSGTLADNTGPPPDLDGYLQRIPARTFMKKLVPGSKGRHEKAIENAKSEFEKELAAWKLREAQRIATLDAARAEHARKQQDFDAKKLNGTLRSISLKPITKLAIKCDCLVFNYGFGTLIVP